MLDTSWAREFAADWIEAWNSRDMDRILSHYADDFEMSSPLVAQRLGDPRGVVKGKKAVRAYWEPSLAAEPPLEFELIDLLVGIDSITLYYRNVGRRVVAETLLFGECRRAVRGMSQWSVVMKSA
jgi:ketosteroid isomerase-like protein